MAQRDPAPRRVAQTQKQNSFFGGAAILAAGILIVKLIGMFYKIPLINIIGEAGAADFNNAYNIYAVLLTVSTAGLPVAVSKLVSEANALNRRNQVRRTFRLALVLFLTLGLISFLVMFFRADALAGMMNDSKAAAGIRALAPAVVCVGCLAALRGYSQGHSNMAPTSVSQIIEALCKLAVGLGLAFWLVKQGKDPDVAAAGAITGVTVGTELWIEDLQKEYDCLYIAIGAHQDKKVGIPGEDSRNVMSAVEMLRSIGDDVMPDFSGKRVVVIGGGNVAMDVTRSSIRLGAEKVTCVYRRRIEDMTALPDEVTGAMAEGAEIAALMAPSHIEADEDGNAAALWVQPQIIGEADKSGRPRPNKADLPEQRIPADIIVVAIGQGIEIQGFEQAGVPIKRGTFVAGLSGQVGSMDNVFAGGDCVTGPATAIRAIAAGKVAAANIDEHLGFRHEITVEVDIPAPRLNNRAPHGRINTTEREACERRCDFEDIECGLTGEGARTEASRCLRCDHYGYGIFRGGRNEKW